MNITLTTEEATIIAGCIKLAEITSHLADSEATKLRSLREKINKAID